MTQLHAGGKFDQNSYKVSGGLHGVGVSVVNALSSWLKLRIFRGGKEHFIEFHHGNAVAPLVVVGDANGRQGTEVSFLASTETFTMVEYDYDTLEHRLRELAFLNSGVRIILTDNRHAERKREEMMYEGGVEAFVRYPRPRQDPAGPEARDDPLREGRHRVEVALWWNDSYHENVLCFTNNIPQRDGGTHLAGFRASLTRQITGYAESSGLTKKEKVSLTGDDCREGLTAVVSVKVPDPKFSSQTEGQARLLEVRPAVENVLNEALNNWLEEHPQEARAGGRQGRGSRRRPRGRPQGPRAHPPQGRARHRVAPGKLADCQERDPVEVRDPAGGGRLGRRLGQAGPRPRLPGRCSPCAERSSTWSARASTRCSAARRSAR
jgi:DNA gyrase subunit B